MEYLAVGFVGTAVILVLIWVVGLFIQEPSTLLMAAFSGDADRVRLLLDQGADVNAKEDGGVTALIYATVGGHTDTARLLLDRGADVKATNNEGVTALINAAHGGHTDTVRLLLDRGAVINASTNIRLTALINATAGGHTDTVRLLLDRGADINAKTNDGVTALINAAGRGHTDTVRILLDRDADINAKANRGVTALINATVGGHTDTVRLLLDRGVEVNAKTNDGTTALTIATRNKHALIADLLLESMNKPVSALPVRAPSAAEPASVPQTSDHPLSEADVLSAAGNPATCLSVARHYAVSGRIQSLIDNYRGQSPAFHDAYGKAYLRLGRYDAVEALLASKSIAGREDREIIRVMERAQRALEVKSIFGAAQGFITRLTAAVELSQRKLHDWALWALDDDVLKTAAGGEAECMQAAEVYRAAGMVAEFLAQKAKGQSPEFTGAYAAAFYSLGDYATALHLLKLRPRVEPERIGMYVHCHKATNSLQRLLGEIPVDSRLRYAQALMDAAEDKAAFGVLSRVPRTTWVPEDFALALRLCDRLDDFKAAADIFGDMQDSVLVKDGPDLYYRYALICEKEGRIDLAQGIYEKLRKRFPDFRDVTARLEKLAALPAEEKSRLSTYATSQDGATTSLGAGAVPRELANKFELRKVLGIGGFGVVYKGFDRNLSRDVAIKVLNRRHQPDERARAAFLDEARMVAALSHPYIVAIHEIVTLGEDNYLVFEFVDGEPLSKIVASRGSLGPKECVRALIFAAEALAYAHKSGVIHRDLKPGNLMWDKRGFVKVMDFGLAFQAGGKAASGGTLPYMAPEQHQSRGTEQSDVFSLGATAYELLTGNLAFTGPDYGAQKNRERYAPLGDKVPQALREFVQKCLKADPAARPKGMAAVRTALRTMG